MDDISQLKPRLEMILGDSLLDRLPPGDLAKTEQAVIMSGFVRQITPRIVDGTGAGAQFNKNSSFHIGPPAHILTQSRPTREYVFSDALFDIIHNPAEQYFFEDERWMSFGERYHELYLERLRAGHNTEVDSMLSIIPPEDYTEGVAALIRLVNDCVPMQQKLAGERVKATHDLIYLLGSKASQHIDIEKGSSKVDVLKGEIVEVSERGIFKSTDLESWRTVFPQGTPGGIVTKCFAHQLFAGQVETDMMTFIHAGINYATEYNLFSNPE